MRVDGLKLQNKPCTQHYRFFVVLAYAGLCFSLHPEDAMASPDRKNVLGTQLVACCTEPPTGYRRDGFCAAQDDDHGTHVVCAEVTNAFLQYSKTRGNDLMTPRPGFVGLKPGDKWCLCVSRWQEALKANVAPRIYLERTDARALETVSLTDLQAHAIDATRH